MPTDETIRKSLPSYLERSLRSIEKTQKSFKSSAVTFSIFLLLSVAIRQWAVSIMFGFFLALLSYSHFRTLKRRHYQIENLQHKLDTSEIKSESTTDETNTIWRRTISRALAALVIINILLMTAIGIASYASKTEPIPLPYAFASSDNSFRMNFPTKPATVNHPTQTLSGQLVSATTYTSQTSDNEETYSVTAYKWLDQTSFAPLSQKDLQSYLVRAAKDNIPAANGKLLKTRQEHILSGNTLTEEAAFRRQTEGHDYIAYIAVFTVDNMEYDVDAQNVNTSSFEHFIKSFQYTGPGDAVMPNPVTYPDNSPTPIDPNTIIGLDGKPPMSGVKVKDANGKPPMSGTTIDHVGPASQGGNVTITTADDGLGQSSSGQ